MLLIRDILNSRQDWITQFGVCQAQIKRLREWYEEPKTDVP